jgi:hypothetical protein
MSWEYDKYEAVCEDCGHQGFCIRGSDDWGRTGTGWKGFENRPPHPYAVARKRASPDDKTPLCACGSTRITVGKYVGKG